MHTIKFNLPWRALSSQWKLVKKQLLNHFPIKVTGGTPLPITQKDIPVLFIAYKTTLNIPVLYCGLRRVETVHSPNVLQIAIFIEDKSRLSYFISVHKPCRSLLCKAETAAAVLHQFYSETCLALGVL